jgi:ethanolamine utilization protein EutQ (cupin superfamily)
MSDRSTPISEGIKKFTIDTATDWMEWSGAALADVANEDDDSDMKLGAVGFTRAPAGVSSTFDFAYDEVLVITKGACTIRSDDRAVTARAGEVVYLPAHVPGTFHADMDVELVYVASSPYGRVNREAKEALLHERR